MKSAPSRQARTRVQSRFIIGPHSPEFSGHGLIDVVLNPASSTWPSVNDPVAMPFRLSQPAVVDQLGWMHGSAAIGGNYDAGVYDASWTRLTSTGSTAGAGTQNEWQFVDVTNVELRPAITYYLAMSADAVTANRLRFYTLGAAVPVSVLCGVQDSATNAFPLPDPLTNMALATVATIFPCCGIALRAPF